jgi:hypothetical protein
VKRFFATILSVLYLVTSSGATINFHYCMGKFIGWDLSLPTNNKCSNCGMEKKNQKGCCNDKHQTIQLKKDQVAITENQLPKNTFYYLDNYYSPSSIKIFSSVCIDKFYAIHSPPGLKVISPFILNCVFRI